MGRQRVDPRKFTTFNSTTYSFSCMLPDESVGKVHKALAKFVMKGIEPDFSTFTEGEEYYFTTLREETEKRWEDYQEACDKKADWKKRKEEEKKREEEQNNTEEVQEGADKCTQVHSSVHKCTQVHTSGHNNNNNYNNNHNTKEESNTKVLSSSSNIKTRKAREEEETGGEEGSKNAFTIEKRVEKLLETSYEERKNAFWKAVTSNEKFKKQYGQQMLDDFVAFYTQQVAESGLMLCEEMELKPTNGRRGTFSVSNRLRLWKNQRDRITNS